MNDEHPRLSANATVVLALKQGIIDGTWPPGALLPPEDELARRVGVSRVPLREGIKQLEALGWLRIERGNGTRVTAPDFTIIEGTFDFLHRYAVVDFQHLHQLRRLIEAEIVRDLARAPPTGLAERLREANAAIARDHDRPEGYVDADVRFHDLLLESSPNPLFPRLLAGFRRHLVLSRRMSFSGPAAVLAAVAAHEVIIVRIADRDPEGARLAMEDHLGQTARQLGLPD